MPIPEKANRFRNLIHSSPAKRMASQYPVDRKTTADDQTVLNQSLFRILGTTGIKTAGDGQNWGYNCLVKPDEQQKRAAWQSIPSVFRIHQTGGTGVKKTDRYIFEPQSGWAFSEAVE